MPRRLKLSERELQIIFDNIPNEDRKTAQELAEELNQDGENRVDYMDDVQRLWSLRKKLSDEEWDEILRNRIPDDLRKRNEMSKTFKVSEGTIRNQQIKFKKYGADISKFLNNKLTQDDLTLLKHEYKHGEENEKIAKQLDVMQSVVDAAIDEYLEEICDLEIMRKRLHNKSLSGKFMRDSNTE